ncbi:MAG TPA: hypothetical protein DCE23_07150 [Firmicutes bacterium]|nr:hypothetical protein [Bacillota bacterium]
MCRTREYQDIINDELEKASQKKAADEQAKIALELEEKRKEKRKLLESKQEVLKSSLTDFSKMIAECSKYISEIQGIINDNSNDIITVPAELLFVKVNEHYEFNPLFLAPGILKYVDLSIISFQDVKVSGIDLSYTNANIDPQKVYKKDMSNGKYCGLDFNLGDFTDVNIDKADFTDAIMGFSVNNTPKK